MSKLLHHIIIAIIILFGLPGSLLTLKAIPCADTKGGLLTAEDTTRCTNEPTVLTLSGSAGNITWMTRPDGVDTWSAIPGETDTFITVQPEINRQYAVLLTGSCTDTSNTITLHVSNFSTIPYPGFGGEACGYYFSLSAFPVYNPLKGFWTQVSGPDIMEFYPSSEQSDPDSVTVHIIGEYEVAWNITDGICTKDSVIEIKVLEQPVANAGKDTNQCGRAFSMNATINIPEATGEWYKVSGSGTLTFMDINDPNTLVNANPGIYNIRWTERNSSCEDDTIIQLIVADRPVANAGQDLNSCEKSVTLHAFPSIGLGNWSRISGPGTAVFNNNNLSTAVTSVSDYGENYIFQWKETNSFCSDSDRVTVHFYEQPVAKISPAEDVCGQQTKLVAEKSITAENVFRMWSFINGPSVPNEFVPVSDTSIAVSIKQDYYGEYIFRWKEKNGSCSDSMDIPVVFLEQPVAKAGNNLKTCGLEIKLDASISIPSGEKIWTVLTETTGLNFSDESDPESQVTAVAYGSYMFVWKETNQICSDSDTIEVEFNEIPDANPGSGGDTCGYGYSLKALPSVPGSTGKWSLSTDTDSFLISQNPEAIAHVDTAGSYNFTWTENNSGCIDQKSVQVTFYYQPEANILKAEDACGTQQTIKTDPVNDANYQWQVLSETGSAEITALSDGDFSITASDTGLYTLLYEINNNRCIDDTTVIIHFFAEPEISAGDDIQTCGNKTSMQASTNLGKGSWSQISGSGELQIDFPNNPSTFVSSDKHGNYTLRWTVQHGACLIADNITVDFIETPVAHAGLGDNICALSTGLNALPEKGYWAISSNESNLEYNFSPGVEANNATLSVDQPGELKLTWIAISDQCTDSSDVTLNFNGKPSADAGPDQELDNIFETTLQAIPPAGNYTGEWYLLSGAGVIVSENTPISDVFNMELGENLFIWKVKNDFCEATDTVSVKIYDIFIPEVITPNGDNENDYFVIRGIQNVGPVEVTIFNRWGIEVYSSNNFQNDWGGTNKNGNLLTNDTYFYVVNIANNRIFKGFVVIKK